LSAPVTVAQNTADVMPPPVVSSPIAAMATSVSGTATANATVAVFADGVYLGTTTADGSGNWTLTGLSPLAPGAYVSAIQTLAPKGTSNWSAPVIVGNIVDLLRSDTMTSLGQAVGNNFVRAFPQFPAMDPLGANHVTNWGEGALQQFPGSSDDDKAYLHAVEDGDMDPDPSVLTDHGRPLVCYELVDDGTHILKLSKADIGGGELRIRISITP
jgi:hypothetical protein